ncbi:MAG: 2-isopropylmalate synthase [Candidatus Dormibacteraeota bacterium]|nr:2-isopropylmalate synthase [Candidatus Dormibacteraeota bacterium]
MAEPHDLIYDWNMVGAPPLPAHRVTVHDETLRDGIQGPSVRDPEVDVKLRFLHLADQLGVGSIDLGLPGAGPRAVAHVGRLAEEIHDQRLGIKALCAARTLEVDIRPVVEISQRVGIPIEVAAFIGSSPIRQYAEGWTIEQMVDNTRKAVRFARQNQLPVMFVTEDTTRAHPDTLKRLFGTAIEEGAQRVAVCDTVGHSTPDGVRAIIKHVRTMLDAMNPDVGLDWHGHSDRGLGLINAIEAAVAGADRIHGCALGLGERVGNTHLDLLLVNFKLLGWIDTDLSKLKEMGEVIAEGTGMAIPANYPVLGADAFRTATGVHAAAVIKAMRKGDDWLANRVYSGVPADLFGCEQVIEIGPMSGESNVIFWLERRSIAPSPDLVRAIIDTAKQGNHLLDESEIAAIVTERSVKTGR